MPSGKAAYRAEKLITHHGLMPAETLPDGSRVHRIIHLTSGRVTFSHAEVQLPEALLHVEELPIQPLDETMESRRRLEYTFLIYIWIKNTLSQDGLRERLRQTIC